MSKSILSNIKECYVCGTCLNLHKHHIYSGYNRKWSEKYGCWVYLCAGHHNMSNVGVHSNKKLDTKLKKECQRAFEKKVGTRDFFMSVFGRNYLMSADGIKSELKAVLNAWKSGAEMMLDFEFTVMPVDDDVAAVIADLIENYMKTQEGNDGSKENVCKNNN